MIFQREGKIFSNYVHSPVLLNEVLTHLISERDEYFLDCTLGEGGHSEAILNKYQLIKAVGIDRDNVILKVAQNRLSHFGERFTAHHLNFIHAGQLNQYYPGTQFNCVLIDLGISIFHYKKSQRGFSFLNNETIDMRLDENGINVCEIINHYPEDELKAIFYQYGEERFSKAIARKIVEFRKQGKIQFTDQLAHIIVSAIPKKYQKQKIHPATRVFQALRIAANDELENIRQGIPAVLSLIKPGGKLGVITFHSIEDRIVKKIFQHLNKECVCPPQLPVCVCEKKREVLLKGKAIQPGPTELENNPSARSAKLRIVEKV